MKTQLYNTKGEVVGDIELSDAIFKVRWNPDLVHQALQAQLANKREPIAHVKGRGEVSGGGRKPWRQKGTGRARHGSTRSPLWKGGGRTHGPSKERSFAVKINTKMKRQAIHSLLSKKLADHEFRVVDSLTLQEPKTKSLVNILKGFYKGTPHVLLLPSGDNKFIFRASSNIPKVKTLHVQSMNIYDLLRYRDVLIDRSAVPLIQ